jgi:hypothetical protein
MGNERVSSGRSLIVLVVVVLVLGGGAEGHSGCHASGPGGPKWTEWT